MHFGRLRLLLLPCRNTHLCHCEGTQGVECEHVLSYNSHVYISIVSHPILWPVLLTFHLAPLKQVRDHHNDLHILLHYHSPEQVHCAFHRSFSCYVCLLSSKPINKICIQIFILFFPVGCAITITLEPYSRVVKSYNIGVSVPLLVICLVTLLGCKLVQAASSSYLLVLLGEPYFLVHVKVKDVFRKYFYRDGV